MIQSGPRLISKDQRGPGEFGHEDLIRLLIKINADVKNKFKSGRINAHQLEINAKLFD